MRLLWRLTSFLLCLGLSAAPALACPLCDTASGKLVREGVFNRHFGVNLFLVLAPFPVCLLIGALLYYGLPTRKRSSFPVILD